MQQLFQAFLAFNQRMCSIVSHSAGPGSDCSLPVSSPAAAAAADTPPLILPAIAGAAPMTPAQQVPTPAVPLAPAPIGFLTQGPWIVGSLYVVVPSGPLLPIVEDHVVDPVWYCITRGHYVGITLSNALGLAAVSGVSGGALKGYNTQALAVAAFNEMLQYGMVAVIP